MLVLLLTGTSVFAETVVKIGVLAFESKADTLARWTPATQYLQSALAGPHFSLQALNYDELNVAVKTGALDFVLTNPEHYVVLRNKFGISPMVTQTTKIQQRGFSHFGSVIFTRADAANMGSLQSVRGKRVAAVGLYSLGGFLAAADVFKHAGINLQSGDVDALQFTGTPHSKVVLEVMQGRADVGIVRTGVLEQMALQGALDLGQVRVINPQAPEIFPQLLSTALFPEWPFAAMPKTDPDLIKQVTLALLNIPPDSGVAKAGRFHGFNPPANYAPVEDLMRRLRVYPQVEAVSLWAELWQAYEHEIEISLLLLLLAGSVASVFLWLGNRRLRHLTQLYGEAQRGLLVTSAAFDSQVGIIVTDEHTGIVRANAAFSKLFGYSEQEIKGKKTSLLRADVAPEGTLRLIWPELMSAKRWQGELPCRHQSGMEIPCIVAIAALQHEGKVTGFVGSFLDISVQKRAESHARQLAFYDPLTNLPNRRLLLERLQQAVVKSVNTQTQGALMFIDLDDFKVLNDTYGHTVGDQLLQQIAARLTQLAGAQAMAARLGGDEFVVMWMGLAGPADVALDAATRHAWDVRRTILAPYELSVHQGNDAPEHFLHYNISGSIGVALFGERNESAAEVLKRADVAMYQAKHGGKDTVRFYDPQVQNMLIERVALSTDLNAALATGQLLLHYQLQVTAQGQAVGAECLLRWRHPVRGMVSPVEFIGLAEDSGAIIGMGDWVARQACETLARWARHPQWEPLTLSINVSPRQFIDTDFVQKVEQHLLQTGANPQRLCLEITEGIVLQDADQVIEKMRHLCALGLSFSIDDFGTGYSSLSYLQRLPLRELKIDKAFVQDLASNVASEAIVRAIVALGHSMQIEVLAEGVETEAQRNRLTHLGCERMQGYLFAKPMELPAMEGLLP